MSFPPPLERQNAQVSVNKNMFPGSVLDYWNDATAIKPEPNLIVVGYNGSKIVRCKYNHFIKRWEDPDGKLMNVYFWSKE